MKINVLPTAALAAVAAGIALTMHGAPAAHADYICEKGVMAMGATSCEFALNVAQAHLNQIGSGPGQLVAYSPVTGQSYTMTCTVLGNEKICQGGNNAMVGLF
jgi:serine/threonine kinase PknH